MASKRLRLADEQRAEDRLRANRDHRDYWYRRFHELSDRIHDEQKEPGIARGKRIDAVNELLDLAERHPEYHARAIVILERLKEQLCAQWELENAPPGEGTRRFPEMQEPGSGTEGHALLIRAKDGGTTQGLLEAVGEALKTLRAMETEGTGEAG